MNPECNEPMEEQIKDKVKQILTDYLQKNGHRKTPERYAILETIYSIKGHFDIDTLYSYMAEKEKFRVSRATLYNTIILLIDAGLVIKHQLAILLSMNVHTIMKQHHHMICTSCGKVSEFEDETLKQAVAQTKQRGFHASHYSLYIYGLCSKCMVAKRKKNK